MARRDSRTIPLPKDPSRKATLIGVAPHYRVDGRYTSPETPTVEQVFPQGRYFGVSIKKSQKP